MTPYPEQTEQIMKTFFNTLSEKDKRRYAAVEAQKLGHGGITYMAQVLGCSRTTIHHGLAELNALPIDTQYEARMRRVGGGRKATKKRYLTLMPPFWMFSRIISRVTRWMPQSVGQT